MASRLTAILYLIDTLTIVSNSHFSRRDLVRRNFNFLIQSGHIAEDQGATIWTGSSLISGQTTDCCNEKHCVVFRAFHLEAFAIDVTLLVIPEHKDVNQLQSKRTNDDIRTSVRWGDIWSRG